MTPESIRLLASLNKRFYETAHDSFSQSRQAPWPGWERVVECAKAQEGFDARALRVLDVACGNLRFERYAAEALQPLDIAFTGIDACPQLVPCMPAVDFVECDIVESLCGDVSLAERAGNGFDVVVCFGFMHHVPSAELRFKLMRQLVECTAENGLLAVSFWRFMSNPRLADKANETTREALARLNVQLEADDYLLGWNDEPGLYRYCHHFPDEEIDAIASSVRGHFSRTEQFVADGRDAALNGYLLFCR